MGKRWWAIGLCILLMTAYAAVVLGEERPGFYANSFVFVGNKAAKLYTLVLELNLGVSPDGAIADYEGWFAIDGRWDSLASVTTRVTGQNPQEVASIPPFDVQKTDRDGYRIAIEETDLKPIALQTEALPGDFTLSQTATLRQIVSMAPAVLEFAGEKIQGYVAYERMVQQGVNPYRRDPENRYGRYERMVLFTPAGVGFLLSSDPGRVVKNPSTLSVRDFTLHKSPQGWQRADPPLVKWKQTTYVLEAQRDIPEEWAIEVPALGMSGFLKDLGHILEHGHIPGTREFWLFGNFTVVGQVTLQREKHVVWGVIQHIQEDEPKR